MRIEVMGDPGPLGSPLCRAMPACDDEMVGVDDLLSRYRFAFVLSDVREAVDVRGRVDAVAHLTSPAPRSDMLAWGQEQGLVRSVRLGQGDCGPLATSGATQ